jgi:hypothetical protein
MRAPAALGCKPAAGDRGEGIALSAVDCVIRRMNDLPSNGQTGDVVFVCEFLARKPTDPASTDPT